ncbi:MAG: AraC family transcriptional regulator [Betaproteobacteria bacterium]|nr:AraC family transcriptional regulator [Betaproteobacteria bacterium]
MVQLDGSADYQLSSEYEALMLEVSDKDMKQAYQAIYGACEGMNLNLAISCPAGSAAALTLLRTISRISQTPKYTHCAALQLERGIKETALLEILMNWPVGTVPIIQEAVLPASTKLARDFIHAYIQDLPTVSDVAASCGIGVRALDRGFKKHLGVSPLQYMLELRLQAVHDDLIANRNGNTVTDVAIHWGFLNLGIFAARYREKFGELPSKTLMLSRQLRQRLN